VALTVAFLGGLLCVFLGERVLPDPAWLRWTLVGAGLLLSVGSTVWRVLVCRDAKGDHRNVERLLVILHGVGLLGLLVYAAGVPAVFEKLGLGFEDTREQRRYQDTLAAVWPVLILCSTVALLFAERAFSPMRAACWIEVRRVRNSMSAGLAIALSACWLLAFGYVAAEYDLKYDASYFRTSRPSESTQAIVKSLPEPLQVLLFFPPVNEVKEEVADYTRDLARMTGKAKVSSHDRLLEPKLAEKHRVSKDGTLVLARGDKRESITLPVEMATAKKDLRTLDQDMQRALLKLVRERRKIFLTTGHGELNDPPKGPAAGRERAGTKDLKKLLQVQNYTIRTLGISDGLANEIPADAAVACVLGPTRPFLAEEIAALRRYADGGGRLLIALDPDAPEAAASFAPLLEALNLAFDPAPLANERMHVLRRRNESDRHVLYSNRYSSHAAVSTLSRHSREVATVTPGTGSLRRVGDQKDGTRVDFIIRAMPETFADLDANYSFDAGSEKRDTYNVAAAVERRLDAKDKKKGEDKRKDEKADKPDEKPVMRAVVLADADALSDDILRNLGNLYLAADSLRWLAGEEKFAGDISSGEADVRIEHTRQEDEVRFYATIFAVPALVLGGGLTYVWRRRRRSAR